MPTVLTMTIDSKLIFRLVCTMIVVGLVGCLLLSNAMLYAQQPVMQGTAAKDSSATVKKPKPTRAQILKMKIEDLLDLPIEEVTELLEIVGVSSLDELINLIVTTASKSEEKLQDAPGMVSVITPREIEGFGALNLVEVLDRVVSMYFIGNATFPQNMLSIRSSAQEAFNTQVLFLIDGRPFRESIHGGFTSPIVPFPLSSIERIEIVRGPGSVLYGTSAYTGVVNIITKTDDVERIRLTARYGSFGTFQGELSGSERFGDLRISGGVNFFNTAGWDFTARGEGDAVRTRDGLRDSIIRGPKTIPMFSRNLGATLKVNYNNFTLNSYFGSIYQASMNANPTWGTTQPRELTADERTNPNIATPATTIERANLINRLIVDAGYVHEFSSIWNASLNVTYNSLLFRFFRTSSDFKDDDVRRQSNDVLVELTNFIKPLPNLNIVVGGLTNTQTGAAFQPTISPVGSRPLLDTNRNFNIATGANPNPAQTIAPYNQTWFTGYLQADWRPVDWLKLIAGGQLNQVTNLPLDFVPRLGVLFNITDELRFKVLYGQAFRSATAFERNTVSMPNILGNPNLLPEKISTLEAQISYTAQNIDISLTAFNSDQDNLIKRTTTDDTLSPLLPWQGRRIRVPIYVNLDRLNSRGIELEAKAQLLENLTLVGSVTYQRNSDGQRSDIFGMPLFMAKAGLLYSTPVLNVGVFNSYFDAGGDITRFSPAGLPLTVNANPPVTAHSELSANITLNLSKLLNITVGESLLLNVYGTNLLNQAIYFPEYVRRNINSIPGRAGLAVYGAVQVNF